jgi:hypothetical protein
MRVLVVCFDRDGEGSACVNRLRVLEVERDAYRSVKQANSVFVVSKGRVDNLEFTEHVVEASPAIRHNRL